MINFYFLCDVSASKGSLSTSFWSMWSSGWLVLGDTLAQGSASDTRHRGHWVDQSPSHCQAMTTKIKGQMAEWVRVMICSAYYYFCVRWRKRVHFKIVVLRTYPTDPASKFLTVLQITVSLLDAFEISFFVFVIFYQERSEIIEA